MIFWGRFGVNISKKSTKLFCNCLRFRYRPLFYWEKEFDFPFADYFSIYIPSAFYPTLIFQKLTLQYNLFEMFLSFSKRFLQCLYIFSEAKVHFLKNNSFFSYNSSFLFDIWRYLLIHGLRKDLVLILSWISEKEVSYALENILINLLKTKLGFLLNRYLFCWK